MTTYVDVDTSAEAIQEDEELIEAVNQIVEKTAEIIYEDVKNDVSSFYLQVLHVIETLFPFLVYWREDSALFWDDMYKLLISGILFVLAFFTLAPSSLWVKKSSPWNNLGQRSNSAERFRILRSWSPFRKGGGGGGADNKENSFTSGRPPVERTQSFSSLYYNDIDSIVDHEEEDEETEVEKFAKRWPSILQTRYRCLVLPPECKRVEKPRNSIDVQENKNRQSDGEMSDHDNPYNRLVSYTKQILHLWVSFLRYDYSGAGSVFFHWLNSCLNARNNRKKTEEEDDIDDDESDAGSIFGNGSSNQNGTALDDNGTSSSGTGSNSNNVTLLPPKMRLRSKRDSLIKWQKMNTIQQQQQPSSEATNIIDNSGESGETNDNVDQIQSTLSASAEPPNDEGQSRERSDTIEQVNSCLSSLPSIDDDQGETNDTIEQVHSSLSSEQYIVGRERSDTVYSCISSIPSDDGDPIRETNDTTDHQANTRHSKLNSLIDELQRTSDELESCLNSEPRLSEEGEEKKDGVDEEKALGGSNTEETSLSTLSLTPPSTPLGRPRRDSLGSIYETPPRHEESKELEPGDVLAAKLAFNARFPAKPKDALESYRTSSNRKTPRLEMKRFNRESSLLSGGFIPEPDGVALEEESGGEGNFFFETVSNNESLRKMAKEVPLPDRNGYILGDDFLVDSECSPLLVFVNSRSGPQQGHLLITQLRGLLNPIQVWDLADGGPEEVLKSFSVFTRLRILVCGGDGTVSWIISTIEKLELSHPWPPIAILPLGTGNDLARVHGWGGGYSNEPLVEILEQIAESYTSWLDRWELTVENKKGEVKDVKSFFNYFGVGADAQMAFQVHQLREFNPHLFFSRFVNKAWYLIFGTEDAIKATSVNLPHQISLIADGVEVPLPPDSQGIILMNIDSYGGGLPLWSRGAPIARLKRSKSLDANWGRVKESPLNANGYVSFMDRIDSVEDLASLPLTEEEKFHRVTACDRPSSCQDGFLDVVSVRGSFHLGQIRVGLSTCQQLCQCRELSIIFKRRVTVQLDGEPWRQSSGTIHIRRKKDAAIMLHRSADESHGVETEMAKLLDWAEDRKYIDNKTHAVLMKEFSRRIESKTRERRERSQDTLMFSLKRAMESSGNLGKEGGAR